FCLGGLAALADHAAALALGRPAPDAIVLAVRQRVLEARLADRTVRADGLGLIRVVIGHGIEDGGIEAPARTLQAPGQVHTGSLPRRGVRPNRSAPPPWAPPSGALDYGTCGLRKSRVSACFLPRPAPGQPRRRGVGALRPPGRRPARGGRQPGQ